MKQIFIQFQKHRKKWITIVRGKHGKTQTFQIYEFLKYFRWNTSAEVHTIPKIWEKWIYIALAKYGKTQRFPIFFTTSQSKSWWEPMQFPMFGNVQISIKWKYSVERHFINRLWVFEEIRSYYKTQIIHILRVM